MQHNTLSLSLLLSAALVAPTLAMAETANYGDAASVETSTVSAENTLQAEVEGPNGELLATQPGEVETEENVVETTSEEESIETQSQEPNQQYSSSEIYPAVTEPTDTDDYAAPAQTDTTLTEDTFQGE